MSLTFNQLEVGDRIEYESFSVGPVSGSIVGEVTFYAPQPCSPALVEFGYEVIVGGEVVHRSDRLERAYAIVDAIVGALVVERLDPDNDQPDLFAAAGLRVVAEGHAVINGEVVRLGERMTTYKDPDGGSVADYEFVTGLEWFEDEDDPRPLRRQTWVLIEDVVGTHYPSGLMLCPFCEDDDDSCYACNDTGEHPYRGAGFVPRGGAPDTEGRRNG